MIYNRFGDTLKIVVNAGEVKPNGFVTPVMLVKCKYDDDGSERWHFADFLKADGGWHEIHHAVESLPVIELIERDQREAIKQAL